MTLGLYPDESRNALDALQRMGPGTPEQAGFLSGIPTGIATGVAEGEVKLGEAAAGAASFGLRKLQSAAMTPGPAAEFAQQTGLDKLDPDEIDQRIRSNSQALLKSVAPDPMTTGYAGQVLHGISSVGVRVVGTGIAGAAGTEGYSTSESMQTQGVDKNTAHVLGVANALMTGAGLKLPIVSGVGNTIAQRVASGAAVNAIMGAADRAAMHTVLAGAGYDSMAAQYRVLDGQAMAVDAVLGGVFGAHGYLRNRVLPSDVDAAHAANDSLHVENDLTPGVPTSTAERDLHVQNMTAATEALLNGTDMPQTRMPDTVANPAQDAIRAQNAAGVADAQAEALNEHGLAGIAPEMARTGERRQDELDFLRMSELRNKGLSSLTPAETTEYAALLERDRLAAKVAGRRLQGVLNMDAYAEAHARGELRPAQGFADLDMLKALNDTMGHQAGDEAIHALGQELSHYFGEGNVFHRGGDEFVTQSATPEAHNAAMDAIRSRLDKYTLRAYKGDQVIEHKGLRFSHGTGKTAELAEQAAYADKQARLRAGLRSERGQSNVRPVVEKPGENRPTGSTAAPRSPTQAVARLTQSLKRLVETNGQDTNAHQTARAVLAHAADAGWDADAIGRAAVDRAGPGADKAIQAAALRESPVAATTGLDPETRESVEHAQSIIERNPELSINDPESGIATAAHDALNQALDELKGAKQEGELAKVAAACFGRGA